jgi:RHH-type proline utilization regulon transcriptional repressor/proline dehydrogenase/delta 1-pyrroline-5-carboxylate dehydrogenase
MTFVGDFPQTDSERLAIEAAHGADETACVVAHLPEASLDAAAHGRVHERAAALVRRVREMRHGDGGLDAFLSEYGLSNKEGVVLMCLAEALLRVPDADTADRLIRDKIAEADWHGHLGRSDSLFVNASTWALMLTGRVMDLAGDDELRDVGDFLGRAVAKTGEPVIRKAMIQAMRILGRQFVMGRTIEEAMARTRDLEAKGIRVSYDMLGEAARTSADAARYFEAYAGAIAALAAGARQTGVFNGPGISVKLSALHPRLELAKRRRLFDELLPRLKSLAAAAKAASVSLCVDAEEADRLEISLDLFEAAFADPALAGWEGLGLAVQAYQKRTPAVIDWLAALSRRHARRITVRLVKGAYWDAEIKRAQERGLEGYPVFTRKASTDVFFLACARRLFDSPDAFYPQFATHNAHTVASVLEMGGASRDYEFQRLHGMGDALYEALAETGPAVACGVYAPVGGHEDLLAYLVRRLLENGANTSFVNRVIDDRAPIEDVIADPAEKVRALKEKPHPAIPLPRALYGDERQGARGVDLGDRAQIRVLAAAMNAVEGRWRAAPVIGGKSLQGTAERDALDPADRRRRIGTVSDATEALMDEALARARDFAPDWDSTPADERARCLERAADGMEDQMPALIALCAREAGKTIDDGIAEVREAVDFCRYYAGRCRAEFASPIVMPGPTGEANELRLHGRGVFACIAPWNFPLAIFTGQVAAALAAGNAVVAKPAEQTPLIASQAVAILHEAGVPADALHLLPGDGPSVGAPLVRDARIDGVAFTGSLETARLINRALADRAGAIAPLIAETGGQNAMIVDSTALSEQVIDDVVTSAFHSAGQRCSALRVLFVQRDVAGRILAMLAGAMDELSIGDPALLETDVGPVIDGDAKASLETHAAAMGRHGRLVREAALPPECGHGTFFAPRAFEIESMAVLEREVFGPILHVITYSADRLDAVVDAVNGTGYGLTLGIHSRIDATQRAIHARLRVGNTYINRNMIGAVVGVQPFGGEGLSGTGPKAGGPRYLHRFATERALSINTAATGGDAQLLSLAEDDVG